MRHRRRILAALCLAALAGVAAPAHAAAPNDGGWTQQWGPKQIGAPSAWEKTTGEGVTIAVVDSGVDVDHPDLKDKLVAGYDFADNDPNPDDDSNLQDGAGQKVKGHGTHVAGITAAITNNNFGVAGVAPGASIMPLKVFPSRGSVLGFGAVPNAIRYAVDQGAKVINLSLGTFETGVSLVGFTQTACSEAYQRGALCVTASGNGGQDQGSGYPNDYPGLMVTANNEKGDRSSFGQRADTQWAVSAPGVAIYSTWPVEDGNFYTAQGTSMAAPHVAGAAALLFGQGLTNAQVVSRLMETARPNGSRGEVGAGIIDVAAAVGQPRTEEPAEARPAPATTTPPPPAISSGPGSQTTTAPAPGGGAPAGTDPAAPAAGGETTETTKRTAGIQLARGGAGGEDDQPIDGGRATLLVFAAALVAATGYYSVMLWMRQSRGRKLKEFV